MTFLDALKLCGAFAAVGLLMEVVFTGFYGAYVDRDRNLMGKVSLWMVFGYGPGGLILDHLRRAYPTEPLSTWIVYVFIIYVSEYSLGWAFERLGLRPWRYEDGWHIQGRIRVDYLPIWMLVALGFNPMAAWLHKVLL